MLLVVPCSSGPVGFQIWSSNFWDCEVKRISDLGFNCVRVAYSLEAHVRQMAVVTSQFHNQSFSQPFQLWRILWHVWPLGIRQYSTIFNIMSHRIHVWYTNIGGILMVNVTIYSIHGSNGCLVMFCSTLTEISVNWRGGTSSVYLVRNPTLEEQFVKANRRSTQCNFLVTQGWRPVQKKHNIA